MMIFFVMYAIVELLLKKVNFMNYLIVDPKIIAISIFFIIFPLQCDQIH